MASTRPAGLRVRRRGACQDRRHLPPREEALRHPSGGGLGRGRGALTLAEPRPLGDDLGDQLLGLTARRPLPIATTLTWCLPTRSLSATLASDRRFWGGWGKITV